MFEGAELHTARYVESLFRALTVYQQATSPAVHLRIVEFEARARHGDGSSVRRRLR